MDDKYNEDKFTFNRVKPIKTEYRTFKIIKDGVEIENPEEYLKQNNINIDDILGKNGGTPFTEVKNSYNFKYSNNPNPFNKEVPKQTLYNGKPAKSDIGGENSSLTILLFFIFGMFVGVFILVAVLGSLGVNWYDVLKPILFK